MTSQTGPTAFFVKTYDEAMSLLIEARNYVAFRMTADMQDSDPEARLLVSQETMRMTCRLTQIMAWMLCQRAVHAGEMTLERAFSDEFAIGGEAVCLDDRWTDDPRLPPAVRSLLDRTHRLYVRVRRLDEMQRRAVTA